MNVRELITSLVVALLAWQAWADESPSPRGVSANSPAISKPEARKQPALDFSRDIRPILSDKCYFCHGPDEEHREADLRLDTREGMFQHPGESKIIVPGKPEESELWRRITHESEDERMPPPEVGKSLTAAQKELVRRWIAEGAVWREHWSFAPLTRPTPPDSDGEHRTLGTVDRFLLARLAREGLTPSSPADPRTLIRRYSLDLIGLPPSAEEVQTFVQHFSASPRPRVSASATQDAETRRLGDAERTIETLVDKLLASPHFGERMAIFWLDLVRYADTVGYHGDQEHAISPYRDYVIQAFNDNMPFDRFTAEQLAGDLLPNATVDQKIASGYNRLLQTSHEGGVQKKEYLAKYSADRVRNLGSAWLSATLACAECHNHKFDPFTQRDFYRLAALFADVDDMRSFKGSDITPTKREPELMALSGLDRRHIAELEEQLAKLDGSSSAEDATRQRTDLEHQIAALRKQTRRTMITEATEPRPIRVLSRGDWMDESGEIVEPGVPAVFRQLETTGRATRLDLARWLTSRDNPLTARVFVNRLWKLFFGKGLAASLEDLGAQGEAPTHGELLDWLAVEFIESGWDVKHMVRLMVLSQAYQQSSLETPELRERDPQNRLLARQARPRLQAELIRDGALAVSGLLVDNVGGRSARPYQPEGYYQHLNFPKRTYVSDKDQQQYRRGVYMHWQRSFLHPMLKAFDAPCREECCAERPTSNTPQAALVMLNDPTFVEAARAFAARILHEGGATRDERIGWAWRAALARDPTERELAVVADLLDRDLPEFRADAAAAESVLKTGLAPSPADLNRAELAAWASVARAIFNLNEFITRN